ncbi:hypothetical protein QUB60_24475 [Microcoleus sp. A2-C5]
MPGLPYSGSVPDLSEKGYTFLNLVSLKILALATKNIGINLIYDE